MGSAFLYDCGKVCSKLLPIELAFIIMPVMKSPYYRLQPSSKNLNVIHTHLVTSSGDQCAANLAREILPPVDGCLKRVVVLVQCGFAEKVRCPICENLCGNRVFRLILGV